MFGTPESDTAAPTIVVLRGEGAYQGLTAIWEQSGVEDWIIRGVIFPDGPPEAPLAP
jgi:hypothetical protein